MRIRNKRTIGAGFRIGRDSDKVKKLIKAMKNDKVFMKKVPEAYKQSMFISQMVPFYLEYKGFDDNFVNDYQNGVRYRITSGKDRPESYEDWEIPFREIDEKIDWENWA